MTTQRAYFYIFAFMIALAAVCVLLGVTYQDVLHGQGLK